MKTLQIIPPDGGPKYTCKFIDYTPETSCLIELAVDVNGYCRDRLGSGEDYKSAMMKAALNLLRLDDGAFYSVDFREEDMSGTKSAAVSFGFNGSMHNGSGKSRDKYDAFFQAFTEALTPIVNSYMPDAE